MKSYLKTEIKKVEKLSKKEIDFMNYCRKKEYGRNSEVNFKKEDKNAIFFFVKKDGQIVAFGMLKPVNVEYLGKRYKILGMGRGMAVEKGMGYGRVLSKIRIDYLKKKSKTALAFTDRKNLGFFKKTGFKTFKNLIKRFVYVNPKTKEKIYDSEGDGVYYEGKDKFISKVLLTKGVAYINVPFW